MSSLTDKELFNKIGRCIESAADNWRTRATISNYHALSDIEADLWSAMKAIKEMFQRRNEEEIRQWRQHWEGTE